MQHLQTFEDCVHNIGLFKEFGGWGVETDGMFICYHNDRRICRFIWLESCMKHRIDGPADIYQERSYWYFLGDRINVSSQEDFDYVVLREIRFM